MRVKELKEKLKEADDNEEVVIVNDGDLYEITEAASDDDGFNIFMGDELDDDVNDDDELADE